MTKPFLKIERGCSRTVFLIWTYAVKFPSGRNWKSFLKGMLHNMQETVVSTMRLEHLCPVIFSSWLGIFIIMPRCQELTEPEYKNLNIKCRFRSECIIQIEDKSSSFGWLNCKIVAIDYGD